MRVSDERAAEANSLLPNGNCRNPIEKLVADLLADREEAATTLAGVLSQIQRLQPGGSPPPGDVANHVAWIVNSVVADREKLLRKLNRLPKDSTGQSIVPGDVLGFCELRVNATMCLTPCDPDTPPEVIESVGWQDWTIEAEAAKGAEHDAG